MVTFQVVAELAKKRDVREAGIDMYRKLFLISAIAIGCVLFYSEWLIYYIVLYQCSWPRINYGASQDGQIPLKTIFLADTHLLGFQDGHWFDRLRREWQMERAFQTAVSLFRPEAVFVLGDLFDEGMKASDEDWNVHLRRFFKMFKHSPDVQFHVVVGNHDIGFHYVKPQLQMCCNRISAVILNHFNSAKEDIHLYQRFSQTFGVTSVKLLELKGNIFVLVNSIAMEGDDCSMCSEAMVQLKEVSDVVNCHKNKEKKKLQYWNKKFKRLTESNGGRECKLAPDASAPVLLQHYPLFRPSESHCTGVDAPPLDQLHQTNREKWEVLSREASKQLLEWFKPRLVLSGHTHHGCYIVHNNVTPELTVPSFSWRNRNNPSFILGTFSKGTFELSKCFLPEESTVIIIYVLSGVFLLIINVYLLFSPMKHRWKFRFTHQRRKKYEMKSL